MTGSKSLTFNGDELWYFVAHTEPDPEDVRVIKLRMAFQYNQEQPCLEDLKTFKSDLNRISTHSTWAVCHCSYWIQ